MGFDGAAVVVIVHPEGASILRFNSEVATSDGEVVAACRVYVERSAALSKNEPRRARGVIERKIVELQDGIFLEESHGAVFKFHFRAAFVGSKNVSLANWQVKARGFPSCGDVGEGAAVPFPREADVALNHAQAGDAHMPGIRRDGMRSSENRADHHAQHRSE